MKRFIALMLAIMLLCLAGCGSKEPAADVDNGGSKDSAANVDNNDKEPAADADDSGDAAADDAADSGLDVAEVYASMIEIMPEMLEMDANMMLNFCGVKEEYYNQAVLAVCFDGLRADEIWLVEAKDAEALETLKGLAGGRLERKGEESITYSPEQYEVVQDAEVIVSGNYLAVIVSPDVDDLAAIFKEAVK